MALDKIIHRCATFLILTMLLLLGALLLISQYDQSSLHLWSDSHHYPWLDKLFPMITHLGDGFVYLALALFSIAFFERRAFMAVLFTATLTLLSTASLKSYFNEDRPLRYFENQGIELNQVEGVKPRYQHSFPSGHTTTAFAAWGLVAFYLRRKPWQVLAFFIAFAAGYSRIYLNMHFLRDVCAGAALGSFVMLLSLFLAYRLNSPWFAKPWFRKEG